MADKLSYEKKMTRKNLKPTGKHGEMRPDPPGTYSRYRGKGDTRAGILLKRRNAKAKSPDAVAAEGKHGYRSVRDVAMKSSGPIGNERSVARDIDKHDRATKVGARNKQQEADAMQGRANKAKSRHKARRKQRMTTRRSR